MRCSEDLRQRVRLYVANGGTKAGASALFRVSRQSVYTWLKDDRPARKPGRVKPDKLDERALKAHIEAYPDAILRERAAHFGMSINGIWLGMRRLGYRKKKSDDI